MQRHDIVESKRDIAFQRHQCDNGNGPGCGGKYRQRYVNGDLHATRYNRPHSDYQLTDIRIYPYNEQKQFDHRRDVIGHCWCHAGDLGQQQGRQRNMQRHDILEPKRHNALQRHQCDHGHGLGCGGLLPQRYANGDLHRFRFVRKCEKCGKTQTERALGWCDDE